MHIGTLVLYQFRGVTSGWDACIVKVSNINLSIIIGNCTQHKCDVTALTLVLCMWTITVNHMMYLNNLHRSKIEPSPVVLLLADGRNSLKGDAPVPLCLMYFVLFLRDQSYGTIHVSVLTTD